MARQLRDDRGAVLRAVWAGDVSSDVRVVHPTAFRIEVRSGGFFDLAEPRAGDVVIHDVAWALAHCCRFAGHTRAFYSVAQHCVLASYIVPPADALAALLHDAAEAYIGDVSRPLKLLLGERIRDVEERIRAAVFEAAGVPAALPPSVKAADVALLLAEKRDLMGDAPWSEEGRRAWDCAAGGEYQFTIDPWPSEWARQRWLERYAELQGQG